MLKSPYSASDNPRHIDVIWPVTAFRVELVNANLIRQLDPFLRVVCALIDHGVTDPERIAAVTGLGEGLVRQLRDDAKARGYLDGDGLSDAGRSALDDLLTTEHETGWMFRNDLTGEVLAMLLDEHPGYSKRPSDALVLRVDRPTRPPDPEAFRKAFYESRSAGGMNTNASRDNSVVRPLGDGHFASLLVRLEVRDVGNTTEIKPRFDSLHPLDVGREDPLFLTRLMHNPNALEVWRQVQSRGRGVLEAERREQHDAGLRKRVDEHVEALGDLSLPTPILEELRNALRQHERHLLRLEKGSNAAVSYGRVAEAVLLDLSPPSDALADLGELACRLHDKSLFHDALAGLLGQQVPEHLCSTVNRQAKLLRKHGGLPSMRARHYGVDLQLAPVSGAALAPTLRSSERFRQAQQRDPRFWFNLLDVIALRNSHAHASRPSATEDLDEALEQVRDHMCQALCAVYAQRDDAPSPPGQWDEPF